jgi:hypothetical protein
MGRNSMGIEEQFQRDHKIDPLALDIEAAQQAERFYFWAERSVKAKAALDALEAKLQKAIRLEPDKYGLEKTTEKSIEAAMKGTEEWQDAKKVSGIADARTKTMDMKKRMIEVLITLHGQQYFAGPSAPRDLAAMWDAQKEEAEQRTNKRVVLRKRKKKRKKV